MRTEHQHDQRRSYTSAEETVHATAHEKRNRSAAAAVGVHQSTGYRTLETAKKQAGNQPSEDSPPRQRTRPDPLATFFESKVVPILERCPDIKPITVFHDLRNTEPEFKPNYRRTLERRIRAWRAQNGAAKEVMFPQTKRPAGTFAFADFTHLKSGEVTIQRESLRHLFCHFSFQWSCYRFVSVVVNGESFTALTEGIQGAFAELGGVPHELRTDSLSTAFRNLAQDVTEDLTGRFKVRCEHYGMKPSRNNRGVTHENGTIESAPLHLKDRVRGELELRGARDFERLDACRTFVADIVARENARVAKDIETERGHPNPLPQSHPCDCEEVMVMVTSTAGFRIRKVYYSVPSRLIGYRLKARVFDDRIELFQGETQDFLTLIARGPCHRFRAIFAFSLHQRAETSASSKWENKADFFTLWSLLVPQGRQNQPQAGDRSIGEVQ